MKKFNQMESNLICDALYFYVVQLEKDIAEMEESGKRSIFAPGFYTMISQELATKVKNMTLYDKLKPEIKAKLEANYKEYSTAVGYISDKLKNTRNYSDLKVDDIKTICTFGDVWHYDLTQSDILYGDWLTNK